MKLYSNAVAMSLVIGAAFSNHCTIQIQKKLTAGSECRLECAEILRATTDQIAEAQTYASTKILSEARETNRLRVTKCLRSCKE